MLIDISSFQTSPISSTCWLMHSINMRYEQIFSNKIFFTVTNLVYIRSQTKSMISISADKSYGVDIMTPLSCSCTLCFTGSTLTHLCISLYINKHQVKKNILFQVTETTCQLYVACESAHTHLHEKHGKLAKIVHEVG